MRGKLDLEETLRNRIQRKQKLTCEFDELSENNLFNQILKTTIHYLLIDDGVDTFLNGGMGAFDWMCARIVHSLRCDYPHIKSYLIIPYLAFQITDSTYFDEVIYPEGFEKYHFKAAIPARNKYMIEHSTYALCYINHSWGGAAQTYAKAQMCGLVTINLFSKE